MLKKTYILFLGIVVEYLFVNSFTKILILKIK